MPTTFTDYKLALGIKNSDKDYELYSSLRGLITELYSVYGICITKDSISHSDTITSQFDTPIPLTHKNIISITTTGFVEGEDYTVDYLDGTVTILSTGTMLESVAYTFEYTYYLFMNESDELLYEIYPEADVTLYHIDIRPINSVLKVQYGNTTLVEGVDYYFYNNKFEVVSAPLNARTPYRISLDVGYAEMPQDLRQTFYEMNNIKIDYRDNKAYMIGKVNETTTGTTTTMKFDMTTVPAHLKEVLLAYTGRRFAS